MKKLSILILLGMVCLSAIPGMAQKMVPYTFRFEHKADSLKEPEVKVLTQVTYAQAVSLRLYFKGTRLGENSYLMLEGMIEARQELRKQDLENWNFSSAYFNGNAVKVSLVAATGEKNVVHISGIKVGEPQAKHSNTARISSESLQSKAQPVSPALVSASSASFLQENPHAKAVGRFTDGTSARGTGWIAANGAIVTDVNFGTYESFEVGNGEYLNDFDIIEFNVPPSNPDGTIKHPTPEDQFPLSKTHFFWRRIEGTKKIGDFAYEYLRVTPYSGFSGDFYTGGYTIIEALPNNKGQRPGERIGEYFQVIRHEVGRVMAKYEMELFSYPFNWGFTTSNQTLRKATVLLKDPNIWLTYVDDKDRFLVYDTKAVLSDLWDDNMEGGPIVIPGSNIAVGIHLEGSSSASSPSFGTGFRDQDFRKHLGEFFTTAMTYVDQGSILDDANGNIYKPYHTVAQGVQNAAENDILNIARGTYNETVYINKPLKLSAPVGKVIIGASGANARTAAGPSIPRELYMDDAPVSFDDFAEELEASATLVSYPNPFTDRTELKYLLPEETLVTVKVYDIVGNEIYTLLQTSQMKGNHSVVWDGRDKLGKPASTGMYIIKLQTGTQIRSVRVIKK